jgi:drug/metabolite transporter (DMT)-like permease
MRTLGIVLIVVGILMMVFRGFNFTREKEVVDIGPIEINKKEKETVGWPIYAGVVATVAGVVILIASRKKA